MGDGKKSSPGFWSVVGSWFACFRRPAKAKAASAGGRTTTYEYGPADGMVAAARHFSSAHKINFG
ncbi:hypothetical protein CFC21_066972 [Triticum aestivum]|uniref:Uncharacterized protein n=4 Tax=Triticum TaxID=4564 RepID=A0A9R0WQJ3_TRITD|nr:hypothetical protein TRIUR3_03962 [Triticum urartu]KAF7060161.1 hypothetical protein CFC21_066972 [Triticum aestivum]VAI20286.1 unnamed protein product [Triticum turgidum subsp. durum]